jgi:hypothetical protein
MSRLRTVAFVAALLAGGPRAVTPAQGQTTDAGRRPPTATAAGADAYVDPTAAALHRAAVANWQLIDETVLRYTALVKHRLAVGLRTPLKDRTLYRNESATRVFWNRDGGTLIQALAAREQTPVGVEPPDITGLMDGVFDPAGDRLLFGMTRNEDLDEAEQDGDFWFEHPLAPDATENYRFATGDTLVLSLPDGREVRAVELQALPRAADVHRISGSLWVEPETGALVRAVYRLADRFDAFRDIPDLQEEEEEDLKHVPGLFKPWTFDLSMVVVDYGLWDFRVWLPRSMRMEGVATAGILKAPMTMDVSYRVESVFTEDDLAKEEAGEDPLGLVAERRFKTRSEAMRYMASLLEEEEGVAFEPEGGWTTRNGRRVQYLVPTDRSWLHESPHLPPPVWEDAPGFPTEEEIEGVQELLQDLPQASPARSFWAANWGLERPGLVRYNRVEGPAVGARLQLRTGSPFGPVSLELVPFLGLADLEPKATATAAWESLDRRTALSVYRRMASAPRRGDHLGLGNSLGALLFGRDDGEYFLATGAGLTLSPPSAERESWSVRLYAERHDPLSGKTDFNVVNAFDDGWRYRQNLAATPLDEAGVELTLSPWWGTDPLAPQYGAELYLQGAAARPSDGDDRTYGRASALLRAGIPFMAFGDRWRLSAGAEAGESWGNPPPQRHWFLGSASTLRGYGASTLRGEAFARGRVELARVFPVASVAVFSDAGWTGEGLDAFDSSEGLVSVGLGASVLDGLVRLDVARGLREPRQTRWDFYLDAAF